MLNKFITLSKDKQIKQLRDILKPLKVGEIIDNSHLNYELLSYLCKKHPSQNKFTEDLSHFKVLRCTYRPKNKNIAYVSKQGNETIFSIYTCVNGKIDTNDSLLKKVLRLAIVPQVNQFRFDTFNKEKYITCEVTGKRISAKSCEIDHIYPQTFEALVNTFVKKYNININDLIFDKDSKTNHPILVTKNIEKVFLDFHKQYAILRCIYWRSNTGLKKNKEILTELL
jgi:hypothetical protein